MIKKVRSKIVLIILMMINHISIGQDYDTIFKFIEYNTKEKKSENIHLKSISLNNGLEYIEVDFNIACKQKYETDFISKDYVRISKDSIFVVNCKEKNIRDCELIEDICIVPIKKDSISLFSFRNFFSPYSIQLGARHEINGDTLFKYITIPYKPVSNFFEMKEIYYSSTNGFIGYLYNDEEKYIQYFREDISSDYIECVQNALTSKVIRRKRIKRKWPWRPRYR